MEFYDFTTRITYSETDRMGVIYYANYLVFFERGRTEFLRAMGLRYRDLEEQQGLYLPALDTQVRYLAPGRYDDLIKVRTFITEIRGAHMSFRYEVFNEETGKLIAAGSSKHAVVNKAWRPIRIPDVLKRLLQAHLERL